MPRPSLLFFVAALLCVLPLLALAFYSHPALDDFAINSVLHNRNVLSYTWSIYLTYSGRFAASLSSVIHLFFSADNGWYRYLIFLFISAWAGSLYAATVALIPAPAAPGQRLLPGSILLIIGLSAFPWPAEGLYWLTGVVAYLLPLILLCRLVVLLAMLYAAPAAQQMRGAWLGCVALGFFIPGFSEITALLLPLVSGAIWWHKALRPARREAYWVLGALAVGSSLTLVAPGNFQRLGHPIDGAQVVHAAVLAAAGTGYLLSNWLGNALLLALTLVLLPVSQAVGRYPGRSLLNRLTGGPAWFWPLLLLLGLFGCLWFCYAAQGIGPALRVKNALFFYFLACWFLSVHAAMRHYAGGPLSYPAAGALRWGLGGLLACCFLTDHNHNLVHGGIGRAPNTVVQAYRDWLSGDAARYSAAQNARYQLLRISKLDSVCLPQLPVRPVTVFYSDISSNPAMWGNQAYARFFSKKAVWVAGSPPSSQ